MSAHWAMAEVDSNGVYWSERCRLAFAAGADCCDIHCPNDYDTDECRECRGHGELATGGSNNPDEPVKTCPRCGGDGLDPEGWS